MKFYNMVFAPFFLVMAMACMASDVTEDALLAEHIRNVSINEITSPNDSLQQLSEFFDNNDKNGIREIMLPSFIGTKGYNDLSAYLEHFELNSSNYIEYRTNNFVLKEAGNEKPYIAVEFVLDSNNHKWHASKITDIREATVFPVRISDDDQIYKEYLDMNESGSFYAGFVEVLKKRIQNSDNLSFLDKLFGMKGKSLSTDIQPSILDRKASLDGLVLVCKQKFDQYCGNKIVFLSINMSFLSYDHNEDKQGNAKWGWLISDVDFKEYDLRKKTDFYEKITGREIKKWSGSRPGEKKSAGTTSHGQAIEKNEGNFQNKRH